MNPDWNKFVREFCQPVTILMMFMVMCLVITIGWQIFKENLIYRKKLGKD